MPVLRALILFLFITVGNQVLIAQDHVPLKGSKVLEEAYIESVDEITKSCRKNLKKEYKSEFKKYYKNRKEDLHNLVETGTFLFDSISIEYLNTLLKKVERANTQFDFSGVRLTLARYFWPNAFSVGDGTIVFNIAIVPYFQNEDQLVYILCHELAHYLAEHTERGLTAHYDRINSDKFKERVKDIKDDPYGKYTKSKSLYKTNIYSQRAHSRNLEREADSLGFKLFYNTNYCLEEAYNAISRLDLMNRSYDTSAVPVFQKLGIDSVSNPQWEGVDIEDRDLKRDKEQIKSHPDVEERSEAIGIMIYEHDPSYCEPSVSAAFNRFRQRMAMEQCESYLRYGRYDRALLYSMRLMRTYPRSRYLKTVSAHALQKLYEARKKHEVSDCCSKPGKYSDRDYTQLLNVVYFARLKNLREATLEYCEAHFDDRQKDKRFILSYARVAKDDGNEELVADLKEHFVNLYPESDYVKNFPFIK